MQKATRYIFTDEDFYLLSKRIPKTPCITCACDKASCGGCSDKGKYDEEIKPFEDAGLIEISEKISRLREISAEIRKLKKEFSRLAEELPPEIRNNENISFEEVID